MGKSIVLLSGGLDSVVLANYVARELGEEVLGVFYNYGQEFYKQELDSVVKCIYNLREHGCKAFLSIEGNIDLIANEDGYNPMRNLIFISNVARLAELEGIKTIYAGFISSIDYSGEYMDATLQFSEDVDNMLFNNFGIHFYTPFTKYSKKDIFYLSKKYEVNLEDTWSCNFPIKNFLGKLSPCGECEDCLLRKDFK